MNPDDFDKRREILKPHVGRRLSFEGVLINIQGANKRSKHHCGLVFASIYAKNENIELDHAVIKIHPQKIKHLNLERYRRYTFTAEIYVYHKAEELLGVLTQRRYYTLTDINLKKLQPTNITHLTQPTKYVQSRLARLCRYDDKVFPEKNILSLINDGTIEKTVDQKLAKTQRERITKTSMISALYDKAN